MLVKIVSVTIERVKKGKSDYSKAVVIYTFNGQARTQNIMSFANPAVFSKIQEWEVALPEGEVNVEVGKNDAGYNEWRSIGAADGNASASSGTSPAQTSSPARASTNTFSGGRDFETREERAARQVLIVKQSSLTAALKYRELIDDVGNVEDVIATAQEFADWVFDNGGPDNV